MKGPPPCFIFVIVLDLALTSALAQELPQTFLNPTPAFGDSFGTSVAAVGNNVLVGAWGDDTVDDDAGAAYLFDASTGGLLKTFLPPTPAGYANFGWSVAALGNNVLVGARHDNTSAPKAGAVYLFDASTGDLLKTILNPARLRLIDSAGPSRR